MEGAFIMERKKVSWEKQVEIVERYLRGEVGYLESVSVKVANNNANQELKKG